MSRDRYYYIIEAIRDHIAGKLTESEAAEQIINDNFTRLVQVNSILVYKDKQIATLLAEREELEKEIV